MSEVRVNNLSNENNTSGPTISGITTYSGRHFFVPPQGDTASRPEDCEPGSFRFNTDTAHLEYFRGNTIGWTEIEAELTAPLGGGTGSNTGLGTRGLVGGGNTPSVINTVEFITLSTFGNSQDFGDLITAMTGRAGSASRTRALFTNGVTPSYKNEIDFFTFSSTGDATDFGNAFRTMGYRGSVSNNIRSVTAGGNNPSANESMDYVTIAQTGNGVDFGDLVNGGRSDPAAMASTTRGIFAGNGNVIDFITIMTTGNSLDFGDATQSLVATSACSNATRGVLKERGSSYTNAMSFLTIATLGNMIDFGDAPNLTGKPAANASPTRGVYAGAYGASPTGFTNQIFKIEFAPTGNGVDFGDLSFQADQPTGASNGHGGL